VARIDEETHVAELTQHQVPARGKRAHHDVAQRRPADENRLEHRLPERAAAAAIRPPHLTPCRNFRRHSCQGSYRRLRAHVQSMTCLIPAMSTLEPVMTGLAPAIHVLLADREEDVDARRRRQVYAVCASLTALPGMTHETPSYVCTQFSVACLTLAG